MVTKNLTGKVILVTGANRGIGYQTVLNLASRNCKVIMTDKDDQTESRKKIIDTSCNENIVTKYLNLASFKCIKKFAEEMQNEEQHLDVLINNAGVFCMKNQKTCDGIDGVLQVNHFGPFLLTNLLTGLLKKASRGRIIFVSASGAFFHNLTLESLLEPKQFSPQILSTCLNYYNSKLCNMITSKGLANILGESNITCNCLHPGMTNTSFLVNIAEDEEYLEKIAKQLVGKVLKYTTLDVRKAAGLVVFLACSESLKNISGEYFVDYQIHRQPRVLEDVEFCRQIWRESERLTGITKINETLILNTH